MLAACLIHASRAVTGLHRVLDTLGAKFASGESRGHSEAADERQTAE